MHRFGIPIPILSYFIITIFLSRSDMYVQDALLHYGSHMNMSKHAHVHKTTIYLYSCIVIDFIFLFFFFIITLFIPFAFVCT